MPPLVKNHSLLIAFHSSPATAGIRKGSQLAQPFYLHVNSNITTKVTMAATTPASDPTILASKRAVYVGGLADEITPQLLRAAMIPFGPIKSLDIPMDYAQGQHKGFGFVEYEDADDASEAIFNMDGADLMGRTIRVSMAQMNQMNKMSTTQAIWSSDEWFQQHFAGQPTPEEQERLKAQSQDQNNLRD